MKIVICVHKNNAQKGESDFDFTSWNFNLQMYIAKDLSQVLVKLIFLQGSFTAVVTDSEG